MACDKTDSTDKGLTAASATTVTQAANDWGVPDWRDAGGYGDVSKFGFFRWRWEFSRRRDDLRWCFDANADASYQRWTRYYQSEPASIQRAWWCVYARKIGVSKPPKPCEPGFEVFLPEPVAQLFGYAGLPNPRISEQPEYCIIPNQDDGTVKYVIGSDVDTLRDRIEKFSVKIEKRELFLLKDMMDLTPVPMKNSEAAIVFDLNKPLPPQIKVAKDSLARLQTDIHGKPLQKRRHPARWLGYLRVLDAREAGVNWAEIAETFYAQGLLDRHKKPSGGYGDPPPQAARDMWVAADALRINF
jgi:hypothetical protein